MTTQAPIEITISIKGTDSTYKQKFLEYKEVSCHHEDPVIRECIEEAKQAYRGEIEDIKITVKFVL